MPLVTVIVDDHNLHSFATTLRGVLFKAHVVLGLWKKEVDQTLYIDPCGSCWSHAKSRGGRRSPAATCWASDQWVANSNPLRSKFRH